MAHLRYRVILSGAKNLLASCETSLVLEILRCAQNDTVAPLSHGIPSDSAFILPA